MQYQQLGVEIQHERTVGLDLERRRVELAGGDVVDFDRLLLATGAEAVRLPELAAGIYLRRLEDADRLRDALAEGRVAIAGAGFIGCEVAASARGMGCLVEMYEALDAPMLRVLGSRLGDWLGEVHRERGVKLSVASPAPVGVAPLLVAVGSAPRVELAEAADLACDRGILVDEMGRTSVQGVFAAGDCARFWSAVFRSHVRVEHFQTAGRHGFAVGRAMAGEEAPFTETPWFWSDQYDLNLQYAGAGVSWDEEVVRGQFGRPPFTVFQLAGGDLVGAVGVNDGHTISRTRRVIEAGARAEPGQLADSKFDLRSLLR